LRRFGQGEAEDQLIFVHLAMVLRHVHREGRVVAHHDKGMLVRVVGDRRIGVMGVQVDHEVFLRDQDLGGTNGSRS
jgi:hypothetical protein